VTGAAIPSPPSPPLDPRVPRVAMRMAPEASAVRRVVPVPPPRRPTRIGAARSRGTKGDRAIPPDVHTHQPTTPRFRRRTVARATGAGMPLQPIPPGPRIGCQRGASGTEKNRSPVEIMRKGRRTAPHQEAPSVHRCAVGGRVPTQRIASTKNWRIMGATTGAASSARDGVSMAGTSGCLGSSVNHGASGAVASLPPRSYPDAFLDPCPPGRGCLLISSGR